MKRLFLVLLTAISLLGQPIRATAAPYGISQELLRTQLQTICEVTQLDCSKVELPDVHERKVADPYTLGLFDIDTPDILWVTPSAMRYPSWFRNAVIIHELTHYVDYWVRGYNSYDHDTSCKTEANAWHMFNVWLIMVGHEEDTDYTWYGRYQCDASYSW